MSIITNFFPIKIPFETFKIRRTLYSAEKLKELRAKHNKTHSFFRRDDFIYISPMKEISIDIGEMVELNVQSNIQVISSLIKHIFFRTFRDSYKDIIPLSFYPFRFLSRKNEDDLLYELLPAELIGLLSQKKQIEIQFRYLENNGLVRFGAVINTTHQWIFHRNCKELVAEGFNIQGSNVLLSESIPGLSGVVAPDESLIGSIVSIDGNFARVETNDGEELYNLEDLYLQKSTRNIREYLEFKLGEEKTRAIISDLRRKDLTRLNAKNYYEESVRIAKSLSRLKYKNNDGFEFFISDRAGVTGESFNIHPPSFLFDYNPGASHENQSAGLLNYGPYDSSTFDIKHPEILVVCHRSNRGAFTEFCGKLRDGIPSSKVFKGGMKGKYRLHDISFDVVELDDYQVNTYLSKIAEYMKSRESFPHLAIIETHDKFKRKPVRENPYYQTKAYFLGLGIPVQFIKNEKIRQTDYFLQWIAESVALQIYAKLGGRPWVLPTSSSIDHELIIGIGSSMLRSNLLAGNQQKRIVGITTFFTGDGRYIFSNKCKDVPYEEYFDELLKNLRQSLKEISDEYGWHKNSTIRITFHIFKPIKNVEAEVVEQLINEYTNFNIQFCFVTVSEHHPFLMFDTKQQGVGKDRKGVYVPARAQNWILDKKSCLLQLKGPDDIKTSNHRFSSPVLVRIHDKSTYTDLNTVVQQIFNFTYLSWRGFSPAQQPVTILYSDLIARQLSNLREIETWKPELVNSLLKAKKWFL